jgi:Ulp1 family protease
MLIPIYRPSHFVLAIISFEKHTIYYLDSLHNGGSDVFERLKEYAQYLNSYFLGIESTEFVYVDLRNVIAHQGNGYDCGCHVVWNMIQYIQGLGIKSPTEMPSNIRQVIALWLLTQDHGLVFPDFTATESMMNNH